MKVVLLGVSTLLLFSNVVSARSVLVQTENPDKSVMECLFGSQEVNFTSVTESEDNEFVLITTSQPLNINCTDPQDPNNTLPVITQEGDNYQIIVKKNFAVIELAENETNFVVPEMPDSPPVMEVDPATIVAPETFINPDAIEPPATEPEFIALLHKQSCSDPPLSEVPISVVVYRVQNFTSAN